MVSGPAARPSLTDPSLHPLWAAVRDRLGRFGPARRGRLRTPELTSRGRWLLGHILGRPPGVTVDLAELEDALRRLEVASDLAAALAALGFAVPPEAEQRRWARRSADEARAAVRAVAAGWLEEGAGEWVDAVVRAGTVAGLDARDAVALVERVRAVLERIRSDARGGGSRLSRVDLAAAVLGSSHDLDWGTRESAAVTRALELRHPPARGRAAWEAAGVDLDLVSAPVLTWGITAGAGGLAPLLAAAGHAGVPVHLSLLALRHHPVVVIPGADILVVENPRLVEAAAQRRLDHGVVALNGNPSTAAQLLLSQLRSAGADLRYHGDFDAAGLRICARMHRMGLRPWQMGAADYREAVRSAEAAGAPLPPDRHRAPPTPWSPGLQAAFDQDRRIVHEERLLPGLLGVLPDHRRAPDVDIVHTDR